VPEIKTRKQKCPARMFPGEAQLFTVSVLHCTPVSPRVKKTFCCQQKSGSHPVDSIAYDVAPSAMKSRRIRLLPIHKKSSPTHDDRGRTGHTVRSSRRKDDPASERIRDVGLCGTDRRRA
jgi:hypothetical protein